MTDSLANLNAEDDINLLDLLVVVVENLRLLVLGPLVAGGVALAAAFMLTPTYESVSVLRPELTAFSPSEGSVVVLGGQEAAAMANSLNVLDALIDANPALKAQPRASARAQLDSLVDAKFDTKSKLLTISAKAETALAAQKLNQDVLALLYQQTRAKGVQLQKIDQQIQQLQTQLTGNQAILQKLQQRIETGAGAAQLQDSTQGYAQMVDVVAKLQSRLSQLETMKNGLTASALVQDPSLPAKSVKPKKALIAVLTSLATGFVLLVFVFVRQALRKGQQDPESAQKLQAIRRGWRAAWGKTSN